MIRLWLSLLAAVLWFPVAIVAADESQTALVSQITVQRTACYGRCPIDAVTFNSNRIATYSGVGYAPRSGLFRGALSAEQFSNVVTFLENQNFFEMKSVIDSRNRLTTDVPDFLVSAVRDGQLYNVAFRYDGNQILSEKFEKTLFGIAETVPWQRDEAASTSGVRGTMRRFLTARETALFRDHKPPVENSVMEFAPVWMESLERKGEIVFTRSDGEGRFSFFAPPGRYSLSTSRADISQQRGSRNAPFYGADPQIVTVEKEKFAAPVINFRDYNSSQVEK